MSGKIEMQQWEEETMKYAKETQRRGIEIGQRCQFGEPRSGRSWRSTVRSSIWAVVSYAGQALRLAHGGPLSWSSKR